MANQSRHLCGRKPSSACACHPRMQGMYGRGYPTPITPCAPIAAYQDPSHPQYQLMQRGGPVNVEILQPAVDSIPLMTFSLWNASAPLWFMHAARHKEANPEDWWVGRACVGRTGGWSWGRCGRCWGRLGGLVRAMRWRQGSCPVSQSAANHLLQRSLQLACPYIAGMLEGHSGSLPCTYTDPLSVCG